MLGSHEGTIAPKQKPYAYAYRYRDVTPPASAKTCYKLVAISGGRFVSIYDGLTEYEVDCTIREEVPNSTCDRVVESDAVEQVRPNHGGGFYVCESMEVLLGMGRLPSNCAKLLSPWSVVLHACTRNELKPN
jgi:hypothetical protein